MSASDDTQKKLINSIRKTKQATTGQRATTKKTAAPAAKPSAPKRQTRKTTARKKARSKAETSKGAQGYQVARRVWPD